MKFHAILTLFFAIMLILFQGCFFSKNQVTVRNAPPFSSKNSNLSAVNIANDQVTITGSGFTNTTVVKIKGQGVDTDLNIASKTDNQIVATATSALSLLANGTYDLIIGTATAQTTYSITFTLQDGAITASKLNQMSATTGQVLKWNGTTWAPSNLMEAQIYLGTWDASGNTGGHNSGTPDLSIVSSNPGEYYITSVAGTLGGISYDVGDWIISDGVEWQKVAASNTAVTSFQGRKGIVNLTPADYLSLKSATIPFKITNSSLNDFADVDLSIAPSSGQALVWNTDHWEAGAPGVALTNLSATAPLTYNSGTGAFGISEATTTAAGSLSSTDKTKLDGLTAIPTSGDGLMERFSGTLAMKTCAGGEMLIWYSPTGWTCTTSVSLGGTSAQTIGMTRNTTANTAGNNLTVEASGATVSSTNMAGGDLVLSSGTSTGTGSSTISFKTASATSTGTTDNAASTKMTILGNGNVGIGTTSPASLLDVTLPSGSKLLVNGTGSYGNFLNNFGFYNIGNGQMSFGILNDTRIVFSSANATLTGSWIFPSLASYSAPLLASSGGSGNDVRWAITKTGDGASQTINALTQVYASSVAGPKLVIGANGIDFALRDNSFWNEGIDSTAMSIAPSTGFVGIGTSSPTSKLQVSGDITPGTTGTYSLGTSSLLFSVLYASNGTINTSDARLKKEIKTSDLGLDFINQLRPVSYYWKSGKDKELHYGLIAQEAERILIKFNGDNNKGSLPIIDHDKKNDRYGIRYTELISPLIKAVQEVFTNVKAILNRLLNLENQTNQNTSEIKSLKQRANSLEIRNRILEKDNQNMKARLLEIEKFIHASHKK